MSVEVLLDCPVCGGELAANPSAPMAHWDCAAGCRARDANSWIEARWAQLGLGTSGSAPLLDDARSA